MTRTCTPFWCSSTRSLRMKRRSNPMRSRISDGGRDQFSELKEKMVRTPMPRSPAARTVRRNASTPRRWPSARGSPRAAAQRPLPSMMMATCRGTANSPICILVSASAFDIATTSHREDLLFLRREHPVDLRDRVVAGLLYLIGRPLAVVLADLVIFFQFLEHIKSVAPDMPHRDPRRLGIFVGDLDQILAPLLIQLGDAQPQHLPLGRWRQPEIGSRDGLFHGMDHRLVPNLDGNQAWLRDADRGDLIERHMGAVGFHLDGFKQIRRCPAGAQPAHLLLEQLNRPLHPPLEFIKVMRWACHGGSPECVSLETAPRLSVRSERPIRRASRIDHRGAALTAEHGLDRSLLPDREHDDRHTIFPGKREGGRVHHFEVLLDRLLMGQAVVSLGFFVLL